MSLLFHIKLGPLPLTTQQSLTLVTKIDYKILRSVEKRPFYNSETKSTQPFYQRYSDWANWPNPRGRFVSSRIGNSWLLILQ